MADHDQDRRAIADLLLDRLAEIDPGRNPGDVHEDQIGPERFGQIVSQPAGEAGAVLATIADEDARHGEPDPYHRRKSRVIAENSSICFARSCGYEIDTSVISPAAFFVASSFGITKPLYDGRPSLSTRATTSSRSFGSKCTP
jgi:hypothetical protein